MSFPVMSTRCLSVRWCINAAVLLTDSRQHARSHTASAARADGDGALGSAVPHPTHLLLQSADHGEGDHPDSSPNQNWPRHCKSNTLSWGEHNGKTLMSLLWCVLCCSTDAQRTCLTSTSTFTWVATCHSCIQYYIRDKACSQWKVMLTFKF